MDEIVFKCEDSMWQMFDGGQKQFDFRRWDLSDERIHHLAGGHWEDAGMKGAMPWWEPDVALISFENKATGQVVTFRYRGMEFTPWAPGWVFLILGGIVRRSPPPDHLGVQFRVVRHAIASTPVVECWRGDQFVATVYGHEDGLRIVSKYMGLVEKECEGDPPSAVVHLKESV